MLGVTLHHKTIYGFPVLHTHTHKRTHTHTHTHTQSHTYKHTHTHTQKIQKIQKSFSEGLIMRTFG